MGLYSNFGLWFSPGFPPASETSQGNGSSERVTAEEGHVFLAATTHEDEIAFRLIPTERSNPLHPHSPSIPRRESTFSYPEANNPASPLFTLPPCQLSNTEECWILICVKLKLAPLFASGNGKKNGRCGAAFRSWIRAYTRYTGSKCEGLSICVCSTVAQTKVCLSM